MNFDHAFDLVFGHEGGYVNDPQDPGGETKFGISKRAYPHLDIKNLTKDDAKRIFYKDFWGPAGCDALPDILKFHVFDFAVNSGPAQAVKILQIILKTDVIDGTIGPKTLAAIGNYDLRELGIRYNLDRLEFMTNLKNFPVHGRGWSRRIRKNILLLLKERK